jgi:serine protease DegS
LETSLGSGVVLSEDGYVLTNNHIIEGADDIKVVLPDGRDVAVQVVGMDPETDIAVLKVAAERLPVIQVGSSRSLHVGDVVLAIGNPFGVGQTVTMGIVSATGRSHLGINTYENFIQTDAAINPGNSGGALINAYGDLVGINNAIFSQTGSSHGIGFAIPAELAIGIMRQIISEGRVVRSWIGVTGQDITLEVAEAFGLHVATGILVSSVMEDGPANRAGIRPGDVITQIDGRAVEDTAQVLNLVAATRPATRMHLGGWRGNEKLEVDVITIERTPQIPARR